jgi:phosphatidylserine/phosphatidylglycerophosphate/cardiolipin synthase-like enzyme
MSFVPDRLAEAKSAILIQQQYIRGSQEHIRLLLSKVAEARESHPEIDIRILLGKIFSKTDLPKEKANLKLLAKDFGLKLGKHIRFVDIKTFYHCHNKLVLIDSDGVRVVLFNPEARSNRRVAARTARRYRRVRRAEPATDRRMVRGTVDGGEEGTPPVQPDAEGATPR